MKILHVLHGLQLGGVAAVVRNLSLRHGSNQIHIVALTQDSSPQAQQRFQALRDDPSITITVLNKPRGRGRLKTIRALRELITSEVTVMFVHHEHVLPMILPAAFDKPCLKIQVIHNEVLDLVFWHRHAGSRFFDHYVFVSENARQYGLHLLKLPESKTSTIRNGIPLTEFTPPFDPQPLSFLFVGRFTAQKNLMGLLERYERYAARSVHPATLTLIGQGEAMSHVLDRLRTSPVSSLITVLPVQGDMPQVYREHGVLLLPSHFEGTPMVILEAMACGMVVIAHQVGDVASLIDHHINGMVISPDDQSGFVEAMLDLEDEPLRLQLRSAALKKAITFSDAAMAEHYTSLIESLKEIILP